MPHSRARWAQTEAVWRGSVSLLGPGAAVVSADGYERSVLAMYFKSRYVVAVLCVAYVFYTASKPARGRAAFEKPPISRFVVDARAERERLPRLFLAGTLANSGSDRGAQAARTHSLSALLFCILRTCSSTNACARQTASRRLPPARWLRSSQAMNGPRRRRLKRQLESTIIHFVGPHYRVHSNSKATRRGVTQPYQGRLDAWTPWTAVAIVVIACV